MGGVSVAGNEARAQVDRILSSELFRDSPIQRRLLTYLVEQSFAGEAPNLKEYTIGTSVFQRGDNFDPRTDSIVRVQVGVLRKKLAAYYDGPGAQDEILIEVPRGHYAPQVGTRPAALPPPAVPVAPRRTGRYGYAVIGLLAGMIAVAAFDRWNGPRPVLRNEAKSEWRDHPVWKGFFEPGAATKLVVGVPMMIGFGGVLIRDTQVNRPEDLAGSERIRQMEAQAGRKGIPMELYTGLGEAAGINVLTRYFHSASQDLPLIRNRLTKWQDLSDGNLIFLASLRFRTLGQELSRPTDFEFAGLAAGVTMIHNRRPLPGEAATYQPQMTDGTVGYDYALVTVWPGTFPGRRIMAIGGSHTWGTEGAVEYITDGPSLRELRDRIGKENGAGGKGLQLLLKVDVRDSQVVSTSYVTHHWLR
ncbi:MAG: hypothetical protein ABJF23_01775 [Bryobacteraceae bacterium]